MERLSDHSSEWQESEATGVTVDGTIIVGTGKRLEGDEAFVWDESHGIRALKAVLETEYCLDLSGWTRLSRAVGISDDGLAITGDGIRSGGETEGWIARTVRRVARVDSYEKRRSLTLENRRRTVSRL